jgi:hypothetical protein
LLRGLAAGHLALDRVIRRLGIGAGARGRGDDSILGLGALRCAERGGRAGAHLLRRVRLLRRTRLADVCGRRRVDLSELGTELVGPHAAELAEPDLRLGGSHVRRRLLRLGRRTTAAARRAGRGTFGGNDGLHVRSIRPGKGVRGVAGVEWRWFAGGIVRLGVYVVSVGRIVGLGLAQRCVSGWLGAFVECLVVAFALAEGIGRCGLRAQRNFRQVAAHRERRGPIGLALELIPRPFTLAAAAALLHDVGELVRDEPIALWRVRLVRACAKMHLAVFRDRLRRARGRGALRNHDDVSQIHVEQPAHPVADDRIQRGDLPGLRHPIRRVVH